MVESRSWLSRQRATFGLPFLVCICGVYFAQGFRSLSGLSTQFWLKDGLGLGPDAIQSLLVTSSLPWSFKPLYGVISDAFPIFGAHRKPYLLAAAAVGLVSWICLAAVAATHDGDSAADIPSWLLLAPMVLSNFSTALSDVIVDAMVAERCGEAARAAVAAGEADDADATGTESENALQ